MEVPFNKFELRIIDILGESFLDGVGEMEIGQVPITGGSG